MVWQQLYTGRVALSLLNAISCMHLNIIQVSVCHLILCVYSTDYDSSSENDSSDDGLPEISLTLSHQRSESEQPGPVSSAFECLVHQATETTGDTTELRTYKLYKLIVQV